MNDNSFTEDNDRGIGYILIRAFTADNAIPLEKVKVKIYSAKKDTVLYNLITDQSGKTESVPISVPPKEDSAFPGKQKKYGTINIEASLKGYHTQTYSDVPIFDTITATQNIAMIPLSDSGTDYIFDYKENMLFTNEENSL